jgi:replicative DNA helicase
MSLHDPVNPLTNIEAEAALLGALMVDNRHIDYAADRLRAEDFYEPGFGRIYSAIVMEYAAGRPANPVTLKPMLAADAEVQALGPGMLTQLTSSPAVVIGAKGFVDQLLELASRRRLIDGLNDTIAAASDPASTIATLIDTADAAIVAATHRGDPVKQISARCAADQFLATHEQPRRGVICSTIPSMDKLLGQLLPAELTIGAGRPGMGKTAAAVSYALGAAQGGYGIQFVSLEMAAGELAGRMLSDLCFDGRGGVPYQNIRDGNLDHEQRRRVFRARDMLDDMALDIVDIGRLTIGRLNMLVRRHKRRCDAKGKPFDLLIVDYLQLLAGDSKHQNRTEEVGEISRGLKIIAKEHGVHVLALAQLSREVEKRADKRPILSDLRESGSIEQDADNVLFLYRHEYYVRASEPEQGKDEYAQWQSALNACQGRIEFIAAKRRAGQTGSAQGEFWAGNQAVRG